MSKACCSIPTAGEDIQRCPASGSEGLPVEWTTVAALTVGRVPARQAFRLCRDAECEVVYYGPAGTVFTIGNLNVQPGFKDDGAGLVCYCFLHRRDDIARQLRETGQTDIFESIKSEVQAGLNIESSRMSKACCSIPTAGEDIQRCPASGSEGLPVEWTTVAALTVGRVPARQAFRLCRDAECEVVYYGPAGTVFTIGNLNVQPGFKDDGAGLVCYCFLHRRDDIARQLRETGQTDIFESIKSEVQAGKCACEVRNPTGKCCLGEVQETIRSLKEEMGVTA